MEVYREPLAATSVSIGHLPSTKQVQSLSIETNVLESSDKKDFQRPSS